MPRRLLCSSPPLGKAALAGASRAHGATQKKCSTARLNGARPRGREDREGRERGDGPGSLRRTADHSAAAGVRASSLRVLGFFLF